MNDEGIRKMLEEIAAKLEAADQHFRQTHEGYPFEVVRNDAPDALPIELNDEGWDAYATAVASGQPFRFELS